MYVCLAACVCVCHGVVIHVHVACVCVYLLEVAKRQLISVCKMWFVLLVG